MSGYLIDTSIFIAAEQGRVAANPPEGRARISVVTYTELLVGRAAAKGKGKKLRELREATLAEARRFVPIPYDEPVAEALATLLDAARRKRPRAKAPLADAIIAATALAHDLTIWTQDRDLEALAKLQRKLRVRIA